MTITSTVTGGDWTLGTSWVGGVAPGPGDDVIIAGPVSVNSNVSCNHLTINSGGTLAITGTNKLTVNGNWENNGTFTTSIGGIIEFAGSNSATISGSQTTNFKNLIVNKTPDRTTLLEINAAATILSGGLLTMTSGLLQINSSGDLDCNHNTQISITTSAGIHVNGGILTTGDFSVNNNGLFKVSSGTATLGEDTGNSLQTGTNGTFQMNGGTLNIAGRLVNTAGTANITGGTINLSTLGHASSTLASFEMSSSTILNITGGIITFTNPNGSTTNPSDIVLISGSGSKTITGGTFQFGTATTTSGSTFIVNSDIPLFNLSVFNNNTTISLTDNLTINNQLTLNGQLLLNDKTLYLPANSIVGTFGAAEGMIVDNQGTSGGEIRLSVPAGGGSFTLPVGDNTGSSTDYTPVTITFSGGNNPGAYATVQTINEKHPQNKNTANYLNRYWTVQTSGVTGSWDFSATYSDGDVVADEAKIDLGTYIGSVWTKGNPANTGANTISITGITASSLQISGISDALPVITFVNGDNQTICFGNSLTLHTTVTGDPTLTFAWSPATNLSATNIEDPIATPTATTAYTLTVTDGNGFQANKEITIVVDPQSAGGAVSGGTTICSGNTSGALTLLGHTGTVTKWQSSVSPFSSWTDIANTTTTYTSGALTQTTQFRAVVTSGVCSSAYSTPTTVTVDPPSVGGTATALNSTLCSGNSTTVTVSGHTGNIQWQQSPDGTSNWTNVSGGSGSTSATYTTPALSAATYYRAIITSGVCASQSSSIAQVTIDAVSAGGTVSSSQTICSGSSPSDLTLSGHTGSVVRWERSANAGFTSPTTISSTSATLSGATIGNLTSNTYFRAVVKNGICAEANSSSVLITVDPVSVGGTVSGGTTICSGSTSGALTLSGHTGTVTKWQSSGSPFTSWTDISNTSTTYTSGALTQTTQFRAVVTSGVCSSANSTPTTVTVNPPSVGGTATALNSILCSGNSTTVTVSGHTGTIQWQQSPDGTTNWANVTGGSGATSATYTTPNLTATTHYRAIVTSGVCAAQASSTAQVSIDPVSVGGTISSAQTICSGSSPSDLTLSGHTGSVVRWERSANAGFTSPTTISNTTTTLTGASIGNLTSNTYFRAIVKSGSCAETQSSSVLITVDPVSVGGTIASSQTICYNTQPANLTLSGHVGNILRWEKSTDVSFTSPVTIAVTSSTLTGATIGNLTSSTYFRAIVKSGTCAATASTFALITINDNLAISKSLTQTPTKPGDNFIYQISYSNLNASCAANNVVIKDYLPAANYFNYVSSSPSGTFDPATQTITWNLGNVSPGNYTITINGKLGTLGNPNWPTYDPASNYIATGSLASTIVSNNATIESATVAPISISAPVTNSVSQYCDFQLQPATLTGYIKQSSPAFIYYALTITNTGNITDKFTFTTNQSGTIDPKNQLYSFFLDNSGNPLTGNTTPWLQPNETYSFLMRFETPNGTNKGTNYTNVITTSFVCQTQKTYPITTNIGNDPAKTPDLSITKVGSPNPATVGSDLTYTITLRNLNADAARNPTISDIIPTTVDLISRSVTSGATTTYNASSRRLEAVLITNNFTSANLPITLTIVVRPSCDALTLGSITNAAEADNNNGELNINDNISTITTNIISDIPPPTSSGTTICQGATASLTASGAGGGYGYKWYAASTGGAALFTGATYATPALNATTTYYVAIYNTSTPVCESSRTPVTVTVLTNPVFTTQPTNRTICHNETTSFTTAATGSLLNYQWQVNTGAGWSDLNNVPPYSGVTTNTLTLTNAGNGLNGFQFQCIVRSGTCTGVTSNTATLTVNPLPVCSITGSDGPLCPSSTGNTYSATAGMSAYSWSISGSGASIVGSTTGQTVSVTTTAGCSSSFDLSVLITNSNGCQEFCTKTVTVQDITDPVITCPSSLPTTVNINNLVNKTYVHSGTGWNATANDNCSTPTLSAVLSGVTNLSGLSTLNNVAFNIGVTTVTWTATDACGRTSTCSYNIEVLGTADLEITKTGATVDASVGTEFIYTITVTNNGPVATPTNSVTISDNVPATFTNPQYSTDGGTNWTSWNGSYQPSASVANGESIVILLRGTPTCSAIGTMSNTATVSLSQITDPDLTNNTSTESTLIEDDTDPTFDLPTLASGYCPEDIYQAEYSDAPYPDDLTYPRPDYFLFASGFTMLNLGNVADNCALKSPEPISWTIDFGNDGSINLSGTGQLSTYGSNIQFPIGTNRITYTVTDAAGNTTVQYRDLIVLPRPDITRNF